MAYLEITLKIAEPNRPAAAEVYKRFKAPFLEAITGAQSKELLIRAEDLQVLHGFDTVENAQAYLESDLFTDDVVAGLKPLMNGAPDIRVYATL